MAEIDHNLDDRSVHREELTEVVDVGGKADKVNGDESHLAARLVDTFKEVLCVASTFVYACQPRALVDEVA